MEDDAVDRGDESGGLPVRSLFRVSGKGQRGTGRGIFLGIGHRNRHLDVFRHIFFGIKSLKIPGIFGKRHLGRV